MLGVFLVAILVMRSAVNSENPSVQNYLPSAITSFAVFASVFVVSLAIRNLQISVSRWVPWLAGLLSLLFALVPWILISSNHAETGALLYRGLRIPQGIERFWDLALVLRSVDCDALGFNVFIDNNGCIQDAAIYGPGMLWLQYVPFHLFSYAHVFALGLAAMAISSLCIVWLAKQSTGAGQIALVIGVVGAPWLLLLERGNVDASLVWIAVAGVFLVRKYPTWWAWTILALGIWLAGTWKYYPFAMGIMLIPVLRLRRGWIILCGWALATAAYVFGSWGNFRFSMQSNTNMIDIGDFVTLGRVPVVARMTGSLSPTTGFHLGDFLIVGLAICAMIWGASLAINLKRPAVTTHSMLASAGSSLFLASVLLGGFGWGYKATFLFLCVPLFSWLVIRQKRIVVIAGFSMLCMGTICSVVVWNTLLASLAGILAASFALGFGFTNVCSGVFNLKLRRLITENVNTETN